MTQRDTTPEPIDEKLLTRIRKMHAKAVSAREIGSEAEAASFAAAVEKMLVKHKLSMSEIEFAEAQADETIDEQLVQGSVSRRTGHTKQARIAWAETLAAIVSRAHFCRIIVRTGSSSFILVGREADRRVAEYVFVTLRRTAETLANQQYRAYRRRCKKEFGDTYDARGYRTAWYIGFVQRIHERYQEEEQTRRIEAAKTSTSLVRLDMIQEELDAHMLALRDTGRTSTARVPQGRSSDHQAGKAAGRSAGDASSLRSNAVAGASTTSSQRLLGGRRS